VNKKMTTNKQFKKLKKAYIKFCKLMKEYGRDLIQEHGTENIKNRMIVKFDFDEDD